MNKTVDLNKVRDDAQELFLKGNFYCSEAIVYSLKQNIDPEMPDALVRAVSGLPVGIGKSKCVCGAVSGAVIGLGYFFGRETPGTPQDEASVNSLKLCNELQDHFRKENKVLCCHVLTNGMDMASGEHKQQCARFTAEMAHKAGEIIARELELEVI